MNRRIARFIVCLLTERDVKKILKVLKDREEKVREREILMTQMEQKAQIMLSGIDSNQSERGLDRFLSL